MPSRPGPRIFGSALIERLPAAKNLRVFCLSWFWLGASRKFPGLRPERRSQACAAFLEFKTAQHRTEKAKRTSQDECGLSQIGLPDTGTAGWGAFFTLGKRGARADCFCSAAFAAITSGSGTGVPVRGKWAESGPATAGSAPFFTVVSLRATEARGDGDAGETAVSWLSASCQMAVSWPLGLPRRFQISWARWAMAVCVGEFEFFMVIIWD